MHEHAILTAKWVLWLWLGYKLRLMLMLIIKWIKHTRRPNKDKKIIYDKEDHKPKPNNVPK